MHLPFFQPATRQENHEWAEHIRKEQRKQWENYGGTPSPNRVFGDADLPPHNLRENIRSHPINLDTKDEA